MDLIKTLDNQQFIMTRVDSVVNWARQSALWPMVFGLACCAIEMMAAGASRFDWDRFGLIPRATPRQSDLIIVAGTVTHKMAIRIKRLYEQMSEPKYVISMGSCANNGGPYWQHGYHAEQMTSIFMEGSEGMNRMKALMTRFRQQPPPSLAEIAVTA